MGYFAYAQYDVKEKYVILNEVKNPTEELTGIYFPLKSWDISLALNITLSLRGSKATAAISREGSKITSF